MHTDTQLYYISVVMSNIGTNMYGGNIGSLVPRSHLFIIIQFVLTVIKEGDNIVRMDPGGGIQLTCLRTLGPCSMLAEQYNRVCHNTTMV